MELEYYFSVTQVLGYIAVIFAIIGTLQKDDKDLIIFASVCYIFMFLHFVMIGSLVTAMTIAIGLVRNIVSLKTKSINAAYFFALLYAVAGLYFMQQPIDLLPTVGAILNTFVIILLSRIKLRLSMILISLTCGIPNAIIIGSIGGFMIEFVLSSLSLVTIYRLYKEDKSNNKINRQLA